MMNVFDGQMRNFGANDARVWSLITRSETPSTSLIAIAELVETRKLSCWMSNRMRTSMSRCGRVETSATAQRE